MTGPQRKMHVLLWLILGPLSLVGLVLALWWRPADPVQDGPLPGTQVPPVSQMQPRDQKPFHGLKP